MIIGVGTDIIEIDRVSRAIQNEHFIKKNFTDEEIKYCENRKINKAASYAVRFAGKEAFFKAIGTGIIFSLKSVEIINDDLGCPHIHLHDKAIEFVNQLNAKNFHISLSHSKNYATAVCVIEK